MERYDSDKPFFLWAGLVSSHPPYNAPKKAYERHLLAVEEAAVDGPNGESWGKRRAHYRAMVEMVDSQVGRMMEALESRGILDNTLVLFVSDHGEMLGGLGYSGKCLPYDPSVRVSCLARFPSLIPAGPFSDEIVAITDLPATVLEVATGCSDPTRFLPRSPGRLLVGHWTEPSEEVRPSEYSEDGGQFCRAWQMVRSRRWKYVIYTRAEAGGGHGQELAAERSYILDQGDSDELLTISWPIWANPLIWRMIHGIPMLRT